MTVTLTTKTSEQAAPHSMYCVAAHVHIPPSHLDWAPTVLPGNIPADAVFSDAPVVAYASLNDFAGNFGHAMFDFVFPVFNILQLLNLYTPSFQLLLAEHQVSRLSCCTSLVASDCCADACCAMRFTNHAPSDPHALLHAVHPHLCTFLSASPFDADNELLTACVRLMSPPAQTFSPCSVKHQKHTCLFATSAACSLLQQALPNLSILPAQNVTLTAQLRPDLKGPNPKLYTPL